MCAECRGFDEGETLFADFYEMVAAYVEGIRRVQPQGPYYVLGYSYGAVVAFEICKMLETKYLSQTFLRTV